MDRLLFIAISTVTYKDFKKKNFQYVWAVYLWAELITKEESCRLSLILATLMTICPNNSFSFEYISRHLKSIIVKEGRLRW